MLMLRIAHIDTERTWRGGEQQVLSIVKSLNERGHYNLVVSRENSALSVRLDDSGISYIKSNPLGEWDLINAWLLRLKLKQHKIDIVHAHTAHAVSLAVLAMKGTGVPVVATRRVDFHLCKNTFSRWKYSQVARIIVISEGVRKILLEDNIPPEKIEIILDGIDFTRYENITPVTKEELGFSKGNLIIGQVAALVTHKDPTNFLNAMDRLRREFPQVRAVLIGEGELRKSLETKIKSLGLGNIVRLLGFKKDVLRYLAAFDVFCLSSKEEGLGTSILDAMALRVPVVATNAGGIPEVVENGVTGYLVPSCDPEALSKALIVALTRNGKNREMAEVAFQKLRRFDVAHIAFHTESLYRSLLKLSATGSARG